MTRKDFFGFELKPGDFIVKHSHGDSLQLLKVDGFTKTSTRCYKITTKYSYDPQTNVPSYEPCLKKVYIKRSGSFLIVVPPKQLAELFDKTDFTKDDKYLIDDLLRCNL